jgi:hypothetical protein
MQEMLLSKDAGFKTATDCTVLNDACHDSSEMIKNESITFP